jgi:hypothetical protein
MLVAFCGWLGIIASQAISPGVEKDRWDDYHAIVIFSWKEEYILNRLYIIYWLQQDEKIETYWECVMLRSQSIFYFFVTGGVSLGRGGGYFKTT